ncbi:MAG TPA: ATP-binding protein [Candidatus Limnocylindrales bacterium]|nr:ATP-binding protein [Candidatus Limnocylindrales bacterium]
MSQRPVFRFIVLDLAIILALSLIGWAAWRLARIEPSIAAQRRQSEQLQELFKETQRIFKENTNDWELTRREFDLSWYEALLLKSEYFLLADRLESSLPSLQNALNTFRQKKGELPSDLPELQKWIEREAERVSLQRLDIRSKSLQERIARANNQATNQPALTEDLGTLVGAIARTYKSCLIAFGNVADNAGKPLVSSAISRHEERGRQNLAELSRLATQARNDGEAIAQFLQNQTSPEGTKRRRRQEELVQAFSEAESPTELVQQLQPRGMDKAGPSSGESGSLRVARYALLTAIAGLGVFLILDLYWRLVVMPLRLKLIEREGQIEHQKKLAHFEELAAELAHEIRNPLTAISALLYTVQRKLHAGTAEHKDAAVIRNELDRVNQILKEFIQMTKPAPPKLELMNAASLLKEVSDLMSPELQRKAVRLESQTPGRAQFYGDQQQLKQVLINLIQNAAESFEQKANRDNNGAVVLRARDEQMPFNGTPTKVAIIEVEDNGPGIRPEVQARLFEPFFSTKKTGTGLGLPISARIIDRHGGKLDVQTQPGHGTTFRIVLLAHEQRN